MRDSTMWLFLVLAACYVCSASAGPVNDTDVAMVFPPQTLRTDTYFSRLVFEDNFEFIDLNKWEYEITAGGGGNWEFQVYTPEEQNTYVRDNTLFIKPTLTADKFGEDFLWNGVLDLYELYGRCTNDQWSGCRREAKYGLINPAMSGKLKSKFGFRYGKMEVMAKMPRGDWIWPAIWMMPVHKVYGYWPRSGEIDVCEARGNRDYGDIGIHRTESTTHWGIDEFQNKFMMTHGTRTANGHTWADGFHKYTLEWTADGIRTWVNDQVVMDIRTPSNGYYEWAGDFNGPNIWANGDRNAPFDKEFYMILNVAIGGTSGFFPDGVWNWPAPKPWHNHSEEGPKEFWLGKDGWYPTWHGEDAAMQVKWIRVYQN